MIRKKNRNVYEWQAQLPPPLLHSSSQVIKDARTRWEPDKCEIAPHWRLVTFVATEEKVGFSIYSTSLNASSRDTSQIFSMRFLKCPLLDF